MTYRHDSDIPYTYGIFEDILNPYQYPPREGEMRQSWPVTFNKTKVLEAFKTRGKEFFNLAKRPKKVAWIVSNCHTHSEREKYAKTLKKFIQVDILGACGDVACEKFGNHVDN